MLLIFVTRKKSLVIYRRELQTKVQDPCLPGGIHPNPQVVECFLAPAVFPFPLSGPVFFIVISARQKARHSTGHQHPSYTQQQGYTCKQGWHECRGIFFARATAQRQERALVSAKKKAKQNKNLAYHRTTLRLSIHVKTRIHLLRKKGEKEEKRKERKIHDFWPDYDYKNNGYLKF